LAVGHRDNISIFMSMSSFMSLSNSSRVAWSHRVIAGVVGGLLVALSLPPFGWWPLAWIGLGVVVLVLPGESWRGRLLIGAGFGLGQYIVGLWWVQEFSIPGYIAVVIVSSLYAMLALVLVPSGPRWAVSLAYPCLLALADWARDRFPLGGLPLGGVSLGQATGPLAPALRLGGSVLLTAEVALVGIALAEMARFALEGRARKGSGLALLVAAAVAIPLAGGFSPSGAGGHLPAVRVALVQGGGPRGTRAVNTDPQVVFDRHLAASSALRPPLDLVVWPEGVLQSHQVYAQSADAQAVAGLARSLHATMIVGVEQDVPVNRYLNQVVAWAPNGQIVATYVKNHLVPFGEYVPDRSLVASIFNLSDVPYDAIPGHGPGFMRTPAGPFALMISFEVFFDDRARGGVRAGGQVLVVPTNTASYRSTQVPTQEVAADRLRVWETGRWLVQVTPTGYSTVVSPTGEVVKTTHLGARAVVTAAVPRRSGMTVFDDVGELPTLVLVLVASGAAWVGAWRAGRSRRGWFRRSV
jgi:apolipoprotein N-acyltransferase